MPYEHDIHVLGPANQLHGSILGEFHLTGRVIQYYIPQNAVEKCPIRALGACFWRLGPHVYTDVKVVYVNVHGYVCVCGFTFCTWSRFSC